jgi:hypothetical protein
MTWKDAVQVGSRRLHVGAADDGRCSIWEVKDGKPVVLVRGRVLGMVQLTCVELIDGTSSDAAVLQRWLRDRICK